MHSVWLVIQVFVTLVSTKELDAAGLSYVEATSRQPFQITVLTCYIGVMLRQCCPQAGTNPLHSTTPF